MTGPEFLHDDADDPDGPPDEELPGAEVPPSRRGRVLLGLAAAVVIGLGAYTVTHEDDTSRRDARSSAPPTPSPLGVLTYTTRPCENTSDYGPRCRFYEPPPLAVLAAVRRAFPGATIRTSTSGNDTLGQLERRTLGIADGRRRVVITIAPPSVDGPVYRVVRPSGMVRSTYSTSLDAHRHITITVTEPGGPGVRRLVLDELAHDPRLLATR